MPNLLERRLEDQQFCSEMADRFGSVLHAWENTSDARQVYKATYDVIMLVYFGKNAPKINLGKPITLGPGDYEQIQTLQDISIAVAGEQDAQAIELFKKIHPRLRVETTAPPEGHSSEVFTVATTYGRRLQEYISSLQGKMGYDFEARSKVTSSVNTLTAGFVESDRVRLWKAHLLLPQELPNQKLLQKLVEP